jgi:hypothetical protein
MSEDAANEVRERTLATRDDRATTRRRARATTRDEGLTKARSE